MFLTAYQQELGTNFPETEEELRSIVQDEGAFSKLIDNCVELIASRSQTSLSKKFIKQRLRYIRGIPSENPDLEEPGKKLSILQKAIRVAVAEAFIDYFKAFQNEKIKLLKGQIRQSILHSLSLPSD